MQQPAPSDDRPPVPVAATGPDDVAAALRDLRTWAGAPSYAEITRGVSAARTARGLPPGEARIGRVTVYDCFRAGRSRLDLDLVTDIVTALGADVATQAAWRQAVRRTAEPGRRLSVAEVVPGSPADRPFFGREDLLTELGDRATDVLIHGMAGIGKTSLALHLARLHHRAGRVEEVLRVDLRGFADGAGPVDPDAVVEATLRVLGLRPDAQDHGPTALLHRVLTERALLLVLDNAADVDQVLPLLPRAGARSSVIVTSRVALRLPGLHALALEELDPGAARSLLVHASSRPADPADDAAVDSVVAFCGRLPLALRLVGRQVARAPGWSWADHARALEQRLTRLDLVPDLDAAVALSYAELSEADRRVFRRVCCHPGPDLGLAAAQVLVAPDADGPDPAAALDRLVTASLLRSPAPGRWSAHDLVRAFGRRRAESEEAPSVLAAALAAVLEHYVDRAAACVTALVPIATADWPWSQGVEEGREVAPEEAMSWLSTERVTLLAAAEWAGANGHGVRTVRLAAVLAHYLWQQGDLDLTLSLHRTARAAAVVTDDTFGLALAERNIGNTLIRMTRFAAARPHLEHAVRLFELTGDARAREGTLNSVAVLASAAGDQESAITAFKAMLHGLEDDEPTERRSIIRANLSIVLMRAGRTEEAIELAVAVAQEAAAHGWRERERWSWINAVRGLWVLGRAEESVVAGERALLLSEEDDDPMALGYAEASLLGALTAAGRFEEAHGYVARALASARRADAREVESMVATNLGHLLLAQGRVEEAAASFADALAIGEEMADADEIALAQEGLALVGKAPASS